MVINQFIGKYAFLNNFYPSSIWIEGKQYKTVEHAYNSFKVLDEELAERIRLATTPLVAKKLSKGVLMQPRWLEDRIKIMEKLIRLKFESPFLADELQKTYPSQLIWENRVGERFWGVHKNVGENHLGIILMKIRNEIMNYEESKK
jgi:ribA/ribD-fused uncharacterized protein